MLGSSLGFACVTLSKLHESKQRERPHDVPVRQCAGTMLGETPSSSVSGSGMGVAGLPTDLVRL